MWFQKKWFMLKKMTAFVCLISDVIPTSRDVLFFIIQIYEMLDWPDNI
jgi:hypothetical protein